MLGITDYLWRLIPANPILLRVVESAGRRRRDLFIRVIYLGLLVGFVVFPLLSSFGSAESGSLPGLARISSDMFRLLSYVQLGLVALLAPIFTAGAITQEKDSQTYDILLATPLSNGQIVLGSLLSRLFFVVALLISGVPIFSITQIFGGVAIRNIVLSFLIAAATAFVTGALAMAIATFKVGTRRTIFSFYLFVVIYLVGGFLLDKIDFFHFDVSPGPQAVVRSKTSWLTGIHPLLALRTIFNDPDYTAPDYGSLPEHLRDWPIGWYLSKPYTFYISLMFFLSTILVLPSIVFLRRIAQSTVSFRGWTLQKLRLSRGETTRKPRPVWNNPIAWREAKTKASAARASVVRYGFIFLGMVAAIVMVYLYSSTIPPAHFIVRKSYDPDQQTLTIFSGSDAPPDYYRVSPNAEVTLNGNPAKLEDLRGKYAVNVSKTGQTISSVAATDIQTRLPASQARSFLLGLVTVEFAVILLIVTNAAASTVTREKEDGSLDLLLTTPITSRYYIWGKLRGLVSYILPLVAVPVASVFIFVLHDMARSLAGTGEDFKWLVFPEAILIMPGVLVIVAAFASILGMQMSLRFRTTVPAVMSSVGIVVGLCSLLGWCGYTFLNNFRSAGEMNLVLASFSPFTVLSILIDPYWLGGALLGGTTEVGEARVIVTLVSWIATGAYAIVVWSMYKSMVKNFDMTIRRQSR